MIFGVKGVTFMDLCTLHNFQLLHYLKSLNGETAKFTLVYLMLKLLAFPQNCNAYPPTYE